MRTLKSVFRIAIVALILLPQFIWNRAAPVRMAQAAAPVVAMPQAGIPLFLPLVLGGTGGGGGGSDAGSLWLPFTLGDGSVLPTYRASVAVDGQGGIHVIYAIYTGTDEQGQKPAIYAHCTAIGQCSLAKPGSGVAGVLGRQL